MHPNIEDIIQQYDIVLFDAVCVICNGWARFLIKYDKKIQFKLVSAQSPLGTALLEHYQMSMNITPPCSSFKMAHSTPNRLPC